MPMSRPLSTGTPLLARPCRGIERIAGARAGSLHLAWPNVDQDPQLARLRAFESHNCALPQRRAHHARRRCSSQPHDRTRGSLDAEEQRVASNRSSWVQIVNPLRSGRV